MWSLWTYFRPARPGSVRLEAEVLDTTPAAARPARRNGGGSGLTRRARSRRRSPGRTSAAFALEWIDGQQRLYLDRGADRLKIGEGLRESDREWLFAVLQRWHAPNGALHLTPAAV